MAFARPAVISGEHTLRLTCKTAPIRSVGALLCFR